MHTHSVNKTSSPLDSEYGALLDWLQVAGFESVQAQYLENPDSQTLYSEV